MGPSPTNVNMIPDAAAMGLENGKLNLHASNIGYPVFGRKVASRSCSYKKRGAQKIGIIGEQNAILPIHLFLKTYPKHSIIDETCAEVQPN